MERGVLEGPPAGDFHELHVDLDGFSWLRLFKELRPPRHSGQPGCPAKQERSILSRYFAAFQSRLTPASAAL
jgi:hypothetical protein